MNELDLKIKDAFQAYWNSLIDALPNIIIGALLFLFFIALAFFVRRLVRKRLTTRIEDVLLRNFIARTTFLSIVILGGIVFMGRIGWGQAAGGLLAGAGVSALIIGFAFKDIGENFIAGFFLAFSRPFRISDIIETQSTIGEVKRLNFRSTHLRTYDGKDVFIPNASLIKEKLINYTRDGLLRHDFIIGLDYDTNVVSAIEDILSVLGRIDEIDHHSDRTPFVTIKEFASSTVNLQIFFWTDSSAYKGSIVTLKTKVMYAVLKELSEKGYGMPADMIELKIYNEHQPIPIQMTGPSEFKPTNHSA